MTGDKADRPRSGRIQLLILALVFVVPFVAAFLWESDRFINTGELVRPVRPLADVALMDLEGRPGSADLLRGKWTLVYLGPAACAQACQQNLYAMRQVRLAQGKDMFRVRYVYVLTDPQAGDLRQRLADHPDLNIVMASQDALRGLAEQLRLSDGTPLDGLERIYVIDPLGNFMMSYPPQTDPNGIKKDISRLLRVSKIG